MVKILIGNENATDNSNLSQFLANDKKYIIENTYDGKSTFNKYIETKPDILILNSSFSDMNYVEIIDHLSSVADKKHNCNTILILNNSEEVYKLNDCTKICKFLKSDYKFEDMAKIVESLELKFKKPELTLDELNIYLSQLCFAPRSLCTDYVRTAVLHCYEHPEIKTSLKNIYTVVAEIYCTEPKTIREGIRKALQPLSNYKRFDTTNLILQIFDNGKQSITPTIFFNRFMAYLEYEREK